MKLLLIVIPAVLIAALWFVYVIVQLLLGLTLLTGLVALAGIVAIYGVTFMAFLAWWGEPNLGWAIAAAALVGSWLVGTLAGQIRRGVGRVVGR